MKGKTSLNSMLQLFLKYATIYQNLFYPQLCYRSELYYPNICFFNVIIARIFLDQLVLSQR